MRRVAIVGCRPPKGPSTEEQRRTFARIIEEVRAFVESLPLDVVVVSGDADGVDSVAADTAERRGMLVCRCPVAPAAWRRLGKRAGMVRNALMVEIADAAHAWPAPWGRGTQQCVELFRAAGKPCVVHEVKL